jgi:uncharacterized protein (TIGR02453 family)
MNGQFPGFSSDLFTFLKELEKNNNREWFNDNKARYRESIVEPVYTFIEAMGQRLPHISESYIADPRANGGSMFRIYRDTRFSRDKTPYKTHVGCQFRHMAGKDAHAPGFYVHIEPHRVFFGGGIWRAPNPVLDKIRIAIVEHPDRWKKTINSKILLKRFGGIEGDGLKRAPRGYDPEHVYIEDLKRKSFLVMEDSDPDIILGSKFINEVDKSFTAASPLMEFITTSLGLSY